MSCWKRGSERKESKYGLALMAAKSRYPSFSALLKFDQSLVFVTLRSISGAKEIGINRDGRFTAAPQYFESCIIASLRHMNLSNSTPAVIDTAQFSNTLEGLSCFVVALLQQKRTTEMILWGDPREG